MGPGWREEKMEAQRKGKASKEHPCLTLCPETRGENEEMMVEHDQDGSKKIVG